VAEEPIDLGLLGAYVDGELDVEERARIAEAVAQDPEVARQVMVLSRLKSTVSGAMDMEAIDLPHIPARRRRWVYGIAASLLVVVLGAGAIWLSLGGGLDGQNGLDRALAAHRSWSTAKQGEALKLKVVRASVPDKLRFAFVPDLSSARLQLVHSSILQGQNGPALLTGYAGSRGCRVTLMATAAGSDVGHKFAFSKHAGVTSAQWRAGSMDYVMLAKGMAQQRFHMLATSVFQASLKAVPISPETRVALARSRAESKPCMLA
jgi:anti-sigma factor RsiW